MSKFYFDTITLYEDSSHLDTNLDWALCLAQVRQHQKQQTGKLSFEI